MALTGIVNLADRLVTQSQPQTGQSSADSAATTAQGSSTAKSPAAPDPSAPAADEFTLSAQTPAAGSTAQAAGLFSVATFSFFSAAAKFLLGNPGSGSPTAARPAPAPPSAPAAATAASATTNPSAQNPTLSPSGGNAPAIASPANADNTPALATLPANSAVSNFPFPASSATSGTPALALIPPSSEAQSASVSSELQSLNTALSALGLPPADIAAIDRIAALLKDFSPAAYSSLLHQFETLAQSQLAPPAATPPSPLATNLSTASPAFASPPAVNSVPKGSRASDATFQVAELLIRFTSVSETQTNNTSRTQSSPQSATNSKTTSRASSASGSQLDALHLGVEEISVTLNNSLGQRAHVHVAQSGKTASTSNSPDSGSVLAKSANA
jgi:hypothetical protein